MLELLGVAGAIASIASLVIVIGFPGVRSYFLDRWRYKKMRPTERDILKAIVSLRAGRLIRQDCEATKLIQLVPIEDGPNVWISHLNVAGHYYVSALEWLAEEGYLRKNDGEGSEEYTLTSSGERFIEKFSKNLLSHQYVGRVRDDVHRARLFRLCEQWIEGTVHTSIGAPPLGCESAHYATLCCLPPAKQENGIVAITYITGKDLPVNEGDMVFVKFEQAPYYLDTYPSPRWIYRASEQVDEHVPTGVFTVRNIHSREDGITEISLSNRRLMHPVT